MKLFVLSQFVGLVAAVPADSQPTLTATALPFLGGAPSGPPANCLDPVNNTRYAASAAVVTASTTAFGSSYGAVVDTSDACFTSCGADPTCVQAVYYKPGKACYPMLNASNADQDNLAGTNTDFVSIHCNTGLIPVDLTGATATQSSTWTPGDGSPGGAADKALTYPPNNACNDGGTLAECTCTNTQSETSPWWKMELPTAAHKAAGKSSKYNGGFSITGVSILNRNSLQDRLNGVTITIGTANNATKSECKPGKPSAAGSSEVAAQSDSKFFPNFGGAPEGTAVSGWNNFVCDSTIRASPPSQSSCPASPTISPSAASRSSR
jgi:hypothetical protein